MLLDVLLDIRTDGYHDLTVGTNVVEHVLDELGCQSTAAEAFVDDGVGEGQAIAVLCVIDVSDLNGFVVAVLQCSTVALLIREMRYPRIPSAMPSNVAQATDARTRPRRCEAGCVGDASAVATKLLVALRCNGCRTAAAASGSR